MQKLLVIFALCLTAAPAMAEKKLIDVPGRRATSRRGRGYRPETLVRALRIKHNKIRSAPAKVAAVPDLKRTEAALAKPGNTIDRYNLYRRLEGTPFDIGRGKGYDNYRREVPYRYRTEEGLWGYKTVENSGVLPTYQQYVSKSIREAKSAEGLLARAKTVESALRSYMDGRFVGGRAKWREKLKAATDEQLFDAARTMINRINDMSHGKTIPQERVGSGSSSSSFSHKTTFTRASSSASSSFHLNQLVPNAATYTFNVADGANKGRSTMIPQEARTVVEMGIHVQDIQRELGNRKSQYATPLSRWVNNSRLSFQGVSGRTGAEVRMDRVSVEALKLKGMGILSPRMARMLDFKKAQTARQAVSSTNPLLD
jgi:hypothetical protein